MFLARGENRFNLLRYIESTKAVCTNSSFYFVNYAKETSYLPDETFNLLLE